MADPLFTFGVTTYNRREMLKECLASIVQQTSPDFEVIVGNDYTDEVITHESLGISDPRIRIINHPRNLGEINNMNYLLAEARGRYFSWLADDDLLLPEFVEVMQAALEKFSYPLCIFPSYNEGKEYRADEPRKDVNHDLQLMSGDAFLQQYLSRTLRLIGCYGGFETEYLKGLGGITALGDGFSPYADNLLAIRAGKLDRVVYIDTPLIFFRTHEESLSFISPDLSAYTSAQQELLSECEDIFMYGDNSGHYRSNMYHMLVWCIRDIYGVLSRRGAFSATVFFGHLRFLERYARSTGKYYPMLLLFNLLCLSRNIARYFKRWMPGRG